MSIKSFNSAIIIFFLLFSCGAQAGKLSIVIDDFGYRPATESQVLNMPINVSIAVLPDAPYVNRIANKAYQQGREVLIHLPMAPLSKQALERNTLSPEMSCDQVAEIIHEATQKVPYAVGLNNHMGSAMASSQ
ncbi:MAG: divergent polysaccharide deacetylase domain-containing protein YibQ [Sodalis sp. Psp]|nr:divergent polysaccharide deacetylase domain-containing protein YibQ [Sodalis sp. Psp]MCR3757141.1 divergent polysaccharide deacetylase domain-containing protein YibQ [Sodalis sp. Ppy]